MNREIQENVENNSTHLEDIVNAIVAKYTDKLDEYMHNIHQVLTVEKDELTESELNKILITLCAHSYFINTKQELLGIRADISKMVRDTKFSENYLVNSGTVASRNMSAELAVKEEDVVSIVYDRAYKILKNKSNVVSQTIDSIKKILTVRMSMMELTHKGA